MATVKFYRGDGTVPSYTIRGDNNFYISTTLGQLWLGQKVWYAGGNNYINSTVSVDTNNSLIITFYKVGGTTDIITLLKGINTSTTNITFTSNNEIEVEVKIKNDGGISIDSDEGLYVDIPELISLYPDNILSVKSDGGLYVPSSSVTVDNTSTIDLTKDSNNQITGNVNLSSVMVSEDNFNGYNILIEDGSGLFATIKPTYSAGLLQLKYWNGSTWVNIGDSVNLTLSSFLVAAQLFNNSTDPNFISWWNVAWGIMPTFSIASIVLVMQSQNNGLTSYNSIVIPVNELYQDYNFEDSETIQFTVDVVDNTTNITSNIKYATNQDTVVVLSDGTQGIKASLLITNTQGDVILSKESDGLKATTNLKDGGGLQTDSNGISVKINPSNNNKIVLDNNGLYVSGLDSTLTTANTNTVGLDITNEVLIANVIYHAPLTTNVPGINLMEDNNGIYAEMMWGQF